MPISFYGPKLKVKRAYKHINELETWLAAINEINADAARSYKDANPGGGSHSVLVKHPPDYADCVSVIVGDAVHCLRTALDFSASSIVAAYGDNPERPPMYFPMGDTRDGFVATAEYRRIERAMPLLAVVLADIIQPYKTGNPLFWALNRLDRMDKHRVLVPTVANAMSVVVMIREDQEADPPPIGPGGIYAIGGRTRADGTIVSVAREVRPGTKAYIHNQNNGYPQVDIRFGKGEAFEDEPIIPTLRQLAELVTGVVETLEAHVEESQQ
jgi:hypothetical protein